MSATADLRLRQLIERLDRLEELAAGRKDQHPLGLGIRKGKSYRTSVGAVPLPSFGPGLERLEQLVSESVPSVADLLAPSAWRALLGRPLAVVPLVVPGESELLERGIGIGAEARKRLRRIGLVTVVRTDDEDEPRVGGTAELFVLLDRRTSRSAEDGWISSDWTTTTRGLSVKLETFVADASVATAGGTTAASAVLMVHADRSEVIDREVSQALMQCAAIFAMDLTILDRGNMNFGHVRQLLTTRPPSVVIAYGPRDPETLSLLEAHRGATEGAGRVVFLDGSDASEAKNGIREHFAALARISPSLSLLPVPVAATEPTRPGLPVTKPGRCMHDDSHRAYVEDITAGVWWTRDTAGHGGSVFKTYLLTAGTLMHQHCTDAHGVPIPKHKGPRGEQIAWAKLHGCADGPHLD